MLLVCFVISRTSFYYTPQSFTLLHLNTFCSGYSDTRRKGTIFIIRNNKFAILLSSLLLLPHNNNNNNNNYI
uniref:Uncharacterized protein n=1 Tax=Anguilla anguilla TaxID=7936 RepID=A0A0E9X3H6_ANGAN